MIFVRKSFNRKLTGKKGVDLFIRGFVVLNILATGSVNG
jgi:hypothetical protein